MGDLFRQFIETHLFNFNKTLSKHPEQITPQKVCLKIQKLLHKNSANRNSNRIMQIGANIQRDYIQVQKQQNMQKNELYMSSLLEISVFIFKLSYSHPGIILYPKYNIENIIGFYEIAKYLCHCENNNILQSSQLRAKFNQQAVTLLFTQKILIYKDIYYRIQESSLFKNFIQELFRLIEMRVQMMLECFGVHASKVLVEKCKAHVRVFVQRYQMTESMRHLSRYQIVSSQMQQSNNNNNNNNMTITINQNIFQSQTITNSNNNRIESQQLLNIISIDQVIMCFVYLLYRSSKQNSKIAMWKLNQSYFKEILGWKNQYKKDGRIVELYNNCYLKLFLSGKLEKIDKSHVVFNEIKSKLFLAEVVQNEETVLDYFASSLEN